MRSPGQWSPVLEDTGHVVVPGQPSTKTAGPAQPHWNGHMGFILTNPKLPVLVPVLERHKADTHLDVGEHMGDLKEDIVVPLLDGNGHSREFIQHSLVTI